MRNENGARLIGQVAVALVLLLRARAGGAAAADCWGKWHLELARPEAEKEAWLSPGSWCRGKTLPATLDVEVRRDGDHTIMTGTPLRPSDVLVGAGKCTFQFSGAESGVATNHTLAIEVGASSVRGSASCSERTPGANGSAGISVGVAVTGSHVAEASPPSVDTGPLVAAVTRACQRHDADALWKLSTPRFHAELDARAAEVRAAVPVSDLRRLYGLRGQPQTFTGLPFLRYAVKKGGAADNPCFDVEHWKVGDGSASPDGRVVAIQRPDGFAFALKFTPGGGGWQLDQLSKSTRAPKP